MKRRLNLELVSFDEEVSTGAVVLVGLIIEIRSLPASAQTAEGARALFPGPTDRLRRRSPVPAPRAALIDGAAIPDSHRQFPLVIWRCRMMLAALCGRCTGQGPFRIGHHEFVRLFPKVITGGAGGREERIRACLVP